MTDRLELRSDVGSAGAEPHTFDLRLWVTAEPPGPAVAAFYADVVDLAKRHAGVEPRWTCERRDRHGRPRIARVHAPPRDLDDEEWF